MRVVPLLCLMACQYRPPSTLSEDGSVTDATPIDSNIADPPIDTTPPVTTIVIEAEAPTTTLSADGVHSWTVETDLAGFTGTGYIRALPDDVVNCEDVADTTCGALNTYDIVIEVAGTYRVIVRHFSPNGSADSVHWYLGSTIAITENLDPDVAATWMDDTTVQQVTLPAGPITFALRMRENNATVDQIRLELQ